MTQSALHHTDEVLAQTMESISHQNAHNAQMRQMGQAIAQTNVAVRRNMHHSADNSTNAKRTVAEIQSARDDLLPAWTQ